MHRPFDVEGITVALSAPDGSAAGGAILPADPPFSVVAATMGQLASEVSASIATELRDRAHELPVVVIGCGRCRVGSTALANVFGLSGIPSLFQPIKAKLRHVLTGGDRTSPFLGDLDAKIVFIKETFGPFVLAECLFNPVEILLDAGYPSKRIMVLGFERDPLDCLDSWLEKWSSIRSREILLENFILSSFQTRNVRDFCERRGVGFAPYRYEWIKNRAAAIRYIERYLDVESGGLAYSVDNWGRRGDLGSAESAISFRPEPDAYRQVFRTVNVHSKEDGYSFIARKRSMVTDADRDRLARSGIFDLDLEACPLELAMGGP